MDIFENKKMNKVYEYSNLFRNYNLLSYIFNYITFKEIRVINFIKNKKIYRVLLRKAIDYSKIFCIQTLNGHTHYVMSLIQLNDGNIASSSYDYSIKICNPNNKYQCIQTLNGHTHYVMSLIQLNDGKIASGSWDNSIKIWDPNNK